MYKELSNVLKILSEENRLKIVDMLSCKELSNKQLLSYLNISQPTLSHHIKSLKENNIINVRRFKNTYYYSLNEKNLNVQVKKFKHIIKHKQDCNCFKEKDAK